MSSVYLTDGERSTARAGSPTLGRCRSLVTLSAVLLAAACGSAQPSSTEPLPSAGVGESAGPTASAAEPTPEPTDPAARVYAHLVGVDSEPGVMLLGGITTSPPFGGVFLGDTWLASAPPPWTRAAPGSAVPIGDAAAYDAGSERVVVFAIVAPGGEPYPSVQETWAYDPATDTWSVVGTAQPAGLHGARAAYDAESDRIIVISEEESAVWAYDLDTDTWEERSNETQGIDTYNGIAYDAESDRVVTFGGTASSGPGVTLAYDYNTDTWIDLSTDSSPSDRYYLMMAYDPTTDRIIMFGGVQGPEDVEAPTDETWAYDLNSNTWTQLHPATAPSPRGWAAFAANPADGTLVLFGGGPTREEATDETWMFDPASDTWTLATK